MAFMAPMTLRQVARRLQLDPANPCRPLSAGQADRYATFLGAHPGEVWGAEWWRPVDTRAELPQVDPIEQ